MIVVRVVLVVMMIVRRVAVSTATMIARRVAVSTATMIAHRVVVSTATMIAHRVVVSTATMIAHRVVVSTATMIVVRVVMMTAPQLNVVRPRSTNELGGVRLAVECRIRQSVLAKIGLMKALHDLRVVLLVCVQKRLVVHKKVVARKYALSML
jgi:hypothetical protein